MILSLLRPRAAGSDLPQLAASFGMLLGVGLVAGWLAAAQVKIPRVFVSTPAQGESWSIFQDWLGKEGRLENQAAVDFSRADPLLAHFRAAGYDLAAVQSGGALVPRIFVDYLPSDMRRLQTPAQRKQTFIKILLPHILAENERIVEDRKRILAFKAQAERGQPLTAEDWNQISILADRYDVARPDDFRTLLTRVDIVPPSLALAQAAEESGWGTSNLAKRGHSLFGQMGWRRTSNGEAEYALRHFDDLGHAVEAYMQNLNTHPAYAEFRANRARLRAEGAERLDARALMPALERYSELGQDYIDRVAAIHRANDFENFDGAQLMPAAQPMLRGRLAMLVD